MCLCVLDLKLGGNDLTKGRPCVLSFSLFLCLSYGCFSSLNNPSSLCVHVYLSLPVSASLSLTPFSLLRLDHQQRRRVKFSTPFSSSFSASALSAPVLLGHSSVFLAVHPVPSQLTSCTRLFFPPRPLFFCHCSPWNSSVSNATKLTRAGAS